MRRVLIVGLLVLLALIFGMVKVDAQDPTWHGVAKHGVHGVTNGTLVNQTAQLIQDGGACWQGANGCYIHYAREYGHKVGSVAVYGPDGQPVTQFPKAASSFGNGVESGRYSPAQMPVSAQARAAFQAAAYAAPRGMTMAVVPAAVIQQATCPHGYTLICDSQSCMCGDPNAPRVPG